MKLNDASFQDKTLGAVNEEMFSIDGDSHVIFDILRNKMYRNPIAAICREVASNSRDANRETGKGDTPIVITFNQPNSYFGISDPSISFEDCGPGITPDRMSDIFLKYGSSTKRDTNEQTGGFGLGAKTPFAYNDTFTVVTVCDFEGKRMKYTYSAMIDSTRKGKMVLFEEVESDEETGTKIIVPVKDGDRDAFEKECINATYLWKIKPEIVNFEREYTNVELLHEDDLYRATYINKNIDTLFIACIDGIPYPVRTSDLGEGHDIDDREIHDKLHIVLDYDNADLTVSANREELQYDEPTKEALINRVMEIKTSLSVVVNEYIETSESYLEASVKCAGIKDSKTYGSLDTEEQREGSFIKMAAAICDEEFEFTWKNMPLYKTYNKSIASPETAGYTLYFVSYDSYSKKSVYDKVNKPMKNHLDMPVYLIDQGKKNIRKNETIWEGLEEGKRKAFLLLEPTMEHGKMVGNWVSFYKNIEGVQNLFGDKLEYYSDVKRKKVVAADGVEKGDTQVTIRVKEHKYGGWESSAYYYDKSDNTLCTETENVMFVGVDSLRDFDQITLENLYDVMCSYNPKYKEKTLTVVNQKQFDKYIKKLGITKDLFITHKKKFGYTYKKKIEADLLRRVMSSVLRSLDFDGDAFNAFPEYAPVKIKQALRDKTDNKLPSHAEKLVKREFNIKIDPLVERNYLEAFNISITMFKRRFPLMNLLLKGANDQWNWKYYLRDKKKGDSEESLKQRYATQHKDYNLIKDYMEQQINLKKVA